MRLVVIEDLKIFRFEIRNHAALAIADHDWHQNSAYVYLDIRSRSYGLFCLRAGEMAREARRQTQKDQAPTQLLSCRHWGIFSRRVSTPQQTREHGKQRLRTFSRESCRLLFAGWGGLLGVDREGGAHCVFFAGGEGDGGAEDVAGFDAEHVLPLVVAEVG